MNRQHSFESRHLAFSEEEAELERCQDSKLSAARPGKGKAGLLSLGPPHQFPAILWHLNVLLLLWEESDVHSDICINAFLMTAFCLPP